MPLFGFQRETEDLIVEFEQLIGIGDLSDLRVNVLPIIFLFATQF